MREYRIYKTDLGYWISRRRMVGTIEDMWDIYAEQYLDAQNYWGGNKAAGKIFYTEDSVVSALVIQRIKDGKDRQDAD